MHPSHSRRLLPPWFAAAALVAPAAAQSVSANATTATPIVVSASTSLTSYTATVPANAPGNGVVSAWAGPAEARSQWTEIGGLGAGGLGVGLEWVQSASCYEAAPSFASTGANELLLQIPATAAAPAVVEVSAVLTGVPGSALPAFSVDVYDDGVVEVGSGGPVRWTGSATLTAQPLSVRLCSQLDQVGIGDVRLELRVFVSPDNRLSIGDVSQPCVFGAGALSAVPVFTGRGVQFSVLTASPTVLVAGLSAQPFALPPALSPAGCTLWPAPEALFLFGLLPGGFQPTVEIAVPAAARPLTLWAQGVDLQPNGLTTTNAFVVLAF